MTRAKDIRLVQPPEPSSRRSPLEVWQEQVLRPCGDCDACCRILGVDEINKPHGEDCRFLDACKGGCGIYGSHPKQCQDYHCFYSYGMLKGGVENRPDKLGVIFSATDEPGEWVSITVNEIWYGASDSPKVQAVMDLVGEKMVVLVGRAGESRRSVARKPAGYEEIKMQSREEWEKEYPERARINPLSKEQEEAAGKVVG